MASAVDNNFPKWSSIKLLSEWLELLSPDDAQRLLVDTPCVATRKFDGTNVAFDLTAMQERGEFVLYGRNNRIVDPKQYQMTDTSTILDINYELLHARLVEAAGVTTNIERIFIYGELIVTDKRYKKDHYNYKTEGLGKKYLVFGAKLVLADDTKDECVSSLNKKGFFAKANTNHYAETTDNIVTISTNTQFAELIRAANGTPVDIINDSQSLQWYIYNYRDSLSTYGEGLVLYINALPRTRGQRERGETASCGFSAVKWKVDFNPYDLNRYKNTYETMQSDPEICELANLLVETEEKRGHKKKHVCQKKNVIAGAITSAMTKFDDVSSFDSIQTYIALVVEEAMKDL